MRPRRTRRFWVGIVLCTLLVAGWRLKPWLADMLKGRPAPEPPVSAANTPAARDESGGVTAEHVRDVASSAADSVRQSESTEADAEGRTPPSLGLDPLFTDATVRDHRPLPPDARGRVRRTRLLKTHFKYPLLRVDETLAVDAATGPERVVARTAVVADHILVKLRPGMTEDDLGVLNAKYRARIRKKMYAPGMYLVELRGANLDSVERAVREYSQEPLVVKHAERDYIVQAVRTPNDPRYAELWGLHNTGQTGGAADADIDAPEAWDIATGTRATLVGVIDTGVDYTHPDLAPNIWTNPGETGTDTNGLDKASNGVDDDANGFVDDVHGWDFYNDDSDPIDDHYHGTHCAGTIGAAGDNGEGVAGVNWRVSIAALKFLSSGGSGSISDGIDAVYYATALRVKLTSNSWGGGGSSQAMIDAIEDARANGILFVAAAGNSAQDADVSPMYPAAYENANIISVAAIDHKDALAYFSNYGAISVDVGAPGVDILSCKLDGSYGTASGTSMACPHVAGVCALFLSQMPTAPPDLTKSWLLDTAEPTAALAGKCVSGGRVNAFGLIQRTAGPWIALRSVAHDDDAAGGTAGNGDGLVNPGETVGLDVTLASVGTSNVTGVVASLATRPEMDAVLVPRGSVWKYLDNGSDQGTAWRGTGFDDGAWSEDDAQLGYGDGDEATVVNYGPEETNKYVTTYFRHTFTADAGDVSSLTLRLLRDDGAVVYLNGTEVHRDNMPAGVIDYRTLASAGVGGADERAYVEAALEHTLLADGTNTLAVEVHQADPGSSDVSFDLELAARVTADFPVSIVQDTVTFGDMPSQTEQTAGQYVLALDPDIQTPYTIPFELAISDAAGNGWTGRFDIAVYTSSEVVGTVTLDGAPLEGASVVYTGTVSGAATTAVDGTYWFTAADGSYAVHAENGDFLPTDPVQLTVPPDRSGVNLAFTNVTLSGTVTEAGTGAPVPGALVRYSGPIDGTATTDAAGVYSITRGFGRDAELGLYAWKHGYLLPALRRVACPPGHADLDFQLEPGTYTVDVLDTLGGGAAAGSALNTNGKIAGASYIRMHDYTMHAVLWADGVPQDLGTLGGSDSQASAINEAGHAAGYSYGAGDSNYHACLWVGTNLTDLGTLGGDYSLAYGMNDAGQVVGYSYLSSTSRYYHAAIWEGAQPSDLGTLGGRYSLALDINNAGLAVGDSDISSTSYVYHAAAWTHGAAPTDLGTLGGNYSRAYAVNDSGTIVGWASREDDMWMRAAIWEGGQARALPEPGEGSAAYDINSAGRAVGYGVLANGETVHAFLWDSGVRVDLNDLLPTNSPWELRAATALNDAGELVGYGYQDEVLRYFVMRVAPVAARPPLAQDADVVTEADTPVGITLAATDSDGDPLRITVLDWPCYGTLSGTPLTVTYTPRRDYAGGDSFTFRAFDGQLYSEPATVSVTVTDADTLLLAYNDFGCTGASWEWLLTNVTTYTRTQSGFLLDYRTGVESGVRLTLDDGGGPPDAWYGENPAYMTEAFQVFGGIVDGQSAIGPADKPVTMTLDGLDPTLKYDVALYCDGGWWASSGSMTCVGLAGADYFENLSSFGAVYAGPTDSETRICTEDNWKSGLVVRYANVEPGTNGQVTLAVSDGGSSYAPDWYVNALVLRAREGRHDGTRLRARVAAGTDDAEESALDGAMSLDSSDLELGHESAGAGHDQLVGLRFANLAVPQGARIARAYVQFQTDEVTAGPVSLEIRGQAIDDAAPFAAAASNISLRARTAAAVSWAPPAWNVAGEAGSAQRTPDLSALITEIVGRADWQPGHALCLIITGTGQRTAEAFEGDAAGAPELFVEYTTVPAAPSDLTAQAASWSTVELGWTDNSANEERFKIDRRRSDGSWAEVGLPPADASAWTDQGLSADTIFEYRVRAWNLTGSSAPSPIATVITPEGPPAAPAGLVAAVAGSSRIDLAWEDRSENEEGFRIARRRSGTSTWQTWTVARDVQTYADTGLTADTLFYYTVRAYNAAGQSAYSPVASARTDPSGPERTVEVRVAASADDAEESILSGSMSLHSSDLELCRDADDQIVGIRFAGLRIPRGAFIRSAYVQFQVDEASIEPTDLMVRGEATADAATFLTNANDISSRPVTQTAIGWQPPPWDTVGEAGSAQRTPDLAAVVQEIVDQPGWTSGNALALMFTGSGRRTAESYDGSAAAAPLLHVQYRIVTPSVADVRVAASPDDAEEAVGSGLVQTASSDLELCREADDQLVGIRITGLPIPPESVILRAYVQFQTDETTTEQTDLTIRAEAADNAAAFESTAGNISSRPLTDVSVAWQPPAWNTVGEAGAAQRTPELAGLIQAIVDRPGWDSGNALALVFAGSGRRTAEAYDGDSAGAPLLHVEYRGTQSTRLATGVDAPGDDAEETVESGTVHLRSSDMELVRDGQDQLVGIRFAVLKVPYQATIVSAHVQFQADETGTETTDLRVRAETSDHAVGFESGVSNISGRALTAAAVYWTPPAWNTEGETGAAQRTPDLSGVVQEIVDRPGWASGNALALVITGSGRRTAESYDGDPAGAPVLQIAYIGGEADPDADTDDLPDAWERVVFGDTTQEATDDHDGDGVSNWAEYIAGTDPTTNAVFFGVDIELDPDVGQIYVSFPTVPLSGPGYAPYGARLYDLQATDTMLPSAVWTGVPGYTNIVGFGQTVVLTNVATADPAFYRARVWLE
ncbi:MAG: S8 family serine peptidase [Kiritimatiellae bacterium]|nr:S8 family serine peptidase [Kiritimatiellia bacterium]